MDLIDEDNFPSYFKNSADALKFFDDLDGYDSGVDELPFSSYATESSEQHFDFSCINDAKCSNKTDGNDDELSYIDDDKDVDYKPNRNISKKGHSKLKRRQYPNTGNRSIVKHELVTPEKQIMSRTGMGQLSIRQYNRKDRTPNTIRKMMERHRENERVRHHSLNESLKDVSMRVPGYEPDSKETKIVQMQRIIGYECFLENTLRNLCQQLDVSLKVLLKGNTQFISDAMENIPFEDFYMSRMLRLDDSNDETLMSTQSITDDLPPGCRIIKSANIEENILKYRREKISSPTVDSTTDNYIQLVPIMPKKSRIQLGTHSKNETNIDNHCDWQPRSGFKPIESSQELLASQESGIKIDTQSSLDELNEIGSLMQDGMYDESEQLRTVTPSFMKEESVTTSTTTEEADESFNFSSPVRYKDTVFLQSPPGRGIWHSSGKSNVYEWRDTSWQMDSVSPENILETRPKSTSTAECQETLKSSIKPMSDILKCSGESIDPNSWEKHVHRAKQADYKTCSKQDEQDNFICSLSDIYNYPVSTICSPRVSIYQPPCFEQKDRKCFKYASNMPSYIPTATTSPPYAKLVDSRGKVIKTAPVRVNIVNASSNRGNKCFQSSQMNRDTRQTVPNTVSSLGGYGIQGQQPVCLSSNRAHTSQIRSFSVPVIPSTSDTKNKRKRYTPFRSSVSNFNQYDDSGDALYPGYVKKMRSCDDEDTLIGFPRVAPLGRTEAGIQPAFSRKQLLHSGGYMVENKRQCAAFIPDSSTNIEHVTVVPEVISVKPENLYFF